MAGLPYPTVVPGRRGNASIRLPAPMRVGPPQSPHASPWAQAPAGGKFNPVPRHLRPNAMFIPQRALPLHVPQVGPVAVPQGLANKDFARGFARALRFGGRMLPYVGPAMLAWDLAEYMLGQPQPARFTITPPHDTTSCSVERVLDNGCGTMRVRWFSNTAIGCHQLPLPGQTLGNGETFPGNEAFSWDIPRGPVNSQRVAQIAIGPIYSPGIDCARYDVQHLIWPVGVTRFPEGHKLNWIPATEPVVPVPRPFGRPHPWLRLMPDPLGVPNPYPRYDPDRGQYPRPRPSPVPWTPVPSVDLDLRPRDVSVTARPGVHYRVPPQRREQEKKKKLSKSDSAWVIKLFKSTVGGITEADDFIRAAYNALPWQVRRWKGRDGVWRDRDHLTHLRAMRIGQHFGSISPQSFLWNWGINNAIDMAGGALGYLNERAIRANPYYRGALGLQSGSRNWNKAAWETHKAMVASEARLKADQAKQPKGIWRRVGKDGFIPHPQTLGIPREQWNAYYRDTPYDWAFYPIESEGFSQPDLTYIPWRKQTTRVFKTDRGRLDYDPVDQGGGNPNLGKYIDHHWFGR